MVAYLSTQDLLSQMRDGQLVLVDIRPSAAFNGWQLKGEARGGHILGAASVPASIFEHLGKAEIKSLLELKGITREKNLVLYAYNGEDNIVVANVLHGLGYENVSIYEMGLQEWASDSNLPMHKLARYEKLVHPGWVFDLIQGMRPPTYQGQGYLVVEVGSGAPKSYCSGHIPGAIYFDLNTIEHPPLWKVVSDNELEKALKKHGINQQKTIVLYSRIPSAAAPLPGPLMDS